MGGMVISPRPGRIPFIAIDRYAERYEIAGSAFDLLVTLIGKLDAEFVKWEANRARERSGAG